MRTVHGRDIREVVKDPTWQALRRALLGTWKHDPAASAFLLLRYVGDGADVWRVARVYNYLTGTAFRTGAIRHPDIDHLLARVRAWHEQHRRDGT